MKKFSKFNGFTLIELLIVIMVLGILAAMIIYSSTETISTAKATVIINNLYKIKKGTLAWYADNREKVREFNQNKRKIQHENGNDALGIGKYVEGLDVVLNKGVANNSAHDQLQEGGYGVWNVWAARTTWYVGYRFRKDEEDVKKKGCGQG